MPRKLLIAGIAAILIAITGCTTSNDQAGADSTTPSGPTQSATSSSAAASSSAGSALRTNDVVGTVIRFTRGDATVDVTITADNPTTRDLLSRFPLTLSVEEFAGREKISYLSPKLETAGSPGSDPENGSLIYFVPWGNLGFYYNTEGVGYSDQTIPLGTYSATLEQLNQLEGADVTVEIVR